jgi:SAM-dependent methyltransferase
MPYKRLFPECEWTGYDIRPVGDEQGDVMDVPHDAEFDTVLCTDVLQYVLAPQGAFTEFADALKDGGHLVVTLPNTWVEDSNALWGFRLEGVAQMCHMAGFDIVDLRAIGGLMRNDFEGFEQQGPTFITTPPELDGFITEQDKRYPGLTCLVARKRPDSSKKEKDDGQESDAGRG